MKTKTIFRLYALVRWLFYFLIILIAFFSSTIGNTVKPILLIPIAICISVNEQDELMAAATGILCGLMIDISFGKIFGYNAIFLIAMCVFSSLLFNHFLRVNVFNITAICTVMAFIHAALDYLFYYAIWGYEHVSLVFIKYTVPSWIYTSLSSIICYFIFSYIYKKFQPKRVQNIEENSNKHD